MVIFRDVELESLFFRGIELIIIVLKLGRGVVVGERMGDGKMGYLGGWV